MKEGLTCKCCIGEKTPEQAMARKSISRRQKSCKAFSWYEVQAVPPPRFPTWGCDPAAQTADLILVSFPAGEPFHKGETVIKLGLLFVFHWHLGDGQPKKYLGAVWGSGRSRKYYILIVQVWFSRWLQRPAVNYVVKIPVQQSFRMY